jgi:DnaJ-class molecular chaperone
MLVNYYNVLEIPFNSSNEEIKKAFRIKAIKYHPDKNNGEENFSKKFLEVKEAYDNLIDPELRKKFDVDYEQYYNNRQKNNHNFVTEANEEKKSVEKEQFNYSC